MSIYNKAQTEQLFALFKVLLFLINESTHRRNFEKEKCFIPLQDVFDVKWFEYAYYPNGDWVIGATIVSYMNPGLKDEGAVAQMIEIMRGTGSPPRSVDAEIVKRGDKATVIIYEDGRRRSDVNERGLLPIDLSPERINSLFEKFEKKCAPFVAGVYDLTL